MIATILRVFFISLKRDRVALMMTFLLPIAFFSIFAMVFGGQGGSSPTVDIAVVDLDGSELYQRADDQPDTVRKRMDQQLGALGEVIEHYRSAGTLSTVDGLQSIDEVAVAIDAALAAVGVLPAMSMGQAAG